MEQENTSLALISRADRALMEANTILKLKDLKDMALTAADWLERKHAGEAIINKARALALDAERKMGEMLKETERARGGRPIETSNTVLLVSEPTLAELGLSKRESSEAQMLATMPTEVFEAVKTGKTTIAKVKKRRKREQGEAALAEAQHAITTEARQSIENVCDLRVCSCADLFGSGIRPDAVITDPPYPKEFLAVFSELALACAIADVPLVAVMSGQSYLPEVMQRLCEHLTYRWTLAYLTPGGQSVQQFPLKVNCFWKPVLLFGEATDWIGDVANSKTNDNDKRFHNWGQSESGMADLVERLTKPGQLVCDPFLGGGSTAVVSLALGRRFVGCDIDAACVTKTRQRVEATLCSQK
ncbi:MAG: DNA methyltransferase [Dehalococcoidia bacterium]|nr:DNA methyltransferase [Dehalococcoidia bacterium]